MNEATRIDETANAYVVKPTPAEFFTYRAPGAREMQWGRLTASDPVVANPHFYVHNRQPPPQVQVGECQTAVASLWPPCAWTCKRSLSSRRPVGFKTITEMPSHVIRVARSRMAMV